MNILLTLTILTLTRGAKTSAGIKLTELARREIIFFARESLIMSWNASIPTHRPLLLSFWWVVVRQKNIRTKNSRFVGELRHHRAYVTSLLRQYTSVSWTITPFFSHVVSPYCNQTYCGTNVIGLFDSGNVTRQMAMMPTPSQMAAAKMIPICGRFASWNMLQLFHSNDMQTFHECILNVNGEL